MLPQNFNIDNYPDYIKAPALSACVAISEILSTPLEKVKVALQIQRLKSSHSFLFLKEIATEMKQVKAEPGLMSFYKGLKISMNRQLIYATTRFYTYYYTMDHLFKNKNHEFVLPQVLTSCVIGTTLGTFFSQPSDITKIRLQGEGKEKTNGLDSIVKLRKVLQYRRQTGVLLPGLGMNIFTQNMQAITELLTFFTVKGILFDTNFARSNYSINATSALVASAMGSLVTAPLDLLYTRSVFKTLNGRRRSPGRIAALVIKKEGIIGLYKSFLPNFFRSSVFNLSMVSLLELVCSSFGQETKFEGQAPPVGL